MSFPDSVLEEFELDDAELVIVTLRSRADAYYPGNEPGRTLAQRLRDIANHLAVEVEKTKYLAEQRAKAQALAAKR